MTRVHIELPARATSPRAARRAVSRMFRSAGVSGAQADDAILIVSELVTNAVHHAGTRLELVAELDERGFRVRVSDHDTAVPRRGVPRPGEPGGWGLNLVDQMATEWGCDVESDIGGKTVWADLPLALPHD